MEIVRQKNVDTRIVFPIVDADGDMVTGAATLDSEYASFSDSDHGGAAPSFLDCTHEATEIGSTGQYYLDVQAAEINADYTIIQVKTSTSGAKTQVILIRTMVGNPLNMATQTSGYELTVDASGNVALADGYITAAKIANGAIDNATFAADVGSTTYASNIIALAVRKTLDELNLDHLCAVATAGADMTTEVIDNSILSRIIGNGDTSTFVPSTDGLRAAGVDLDAIITDVAAVHVHAGNIDTQVGTAGAGLTGVPWNSSWDAEVQSECDDALVAKNLDHLCAVATAAADMTTEVVDNSIISRIIGNGDTSTFVPSTDGLRAAGVDLDAILADTNELQTDWVNGGRLDLILDAAGAAGDPWITELPGSYTGIQAGKLISDMKADVAAVHVHAGNIDTQVGTAGAGLTGVPWNSSWDAEVQSECDDALVANNLDHLCKTATAAADMTTEVVDNSIISRIIGNGDTSTFVPSTDGLHAAGVDLDAILADTNELQTDWVNGGRLDLILDAAATQTSVNTIDGIVDDILLDTAVIGAAGAGLTGIPWNAAWDAEVQSEVDDALATALTELSQGTPPATPTIKQALMLLYMALRNETNTTSALLSIKNDAGTVICKATLSDNGTTFVKGEMVSGA